jgi:hypothetical protein
MQLPEILPKKLVGETGVEPAPSWSRTKRATRLRYSPSHPLTEKQRQL